jgi:hypothetical protein
MNKPRKRVIFCRTVLSLVFVIFVICEAVKIHTTGPDIEAYRGTGGDTPITRAYLSDLEVRLRELREKERRGIAAKAEHRRTMPETIALIRGLLEKRRIKPERFRITGKEPDESAEFIIHSNPIPFLNFLMEMPENTIPISYINIRPDMLTAAIDITMRFKHAY